MNYPVPALSVPVRKSRIGHGIPGMRSGAPVHRPCHRGAARVPGDSQNGASVTEICRRLDGIPRSRSSSPRRRVRALSVESIAARLVDRFRLLTRGDTSALPRQQDVARPDRLELRPAHGARAHSVPAARGLRRRLDARSCGAGGRGWRGRQAAVLDLLGNLVENNRWSSWRSTAIATGCWRRFGNTHGSGSPKRAKAARSGPAILSSTWHLRRRVNPNLMGPEQGAWLARLDRRTENLARRARVVWAGGEWGRAGLAARAALKLYLVNRGLLYPAAAGGRGGARPSGSASSEAWHVAG